MVKASLGIAGSAKVEGAARVPGTGAMTTTTNPAVKRAMVFWGVAVGLLFLFHVGGANLG